MEAAVFPLFIWLLLCYQVLAMPKVDMCKWTPIVRHAQLRDGMSSGTFHRLGSTPTMETCVDLCCSMDICGVAFRYQGNCYGVECNGDKSCESLPADPTAMKVEIAHVRAGRVTANMTDMDKAGQCQPSSVFKEVTLKGGINAGTYKDVGGVNTMEECQTKCCEFPACDLAFMLAGSCYLVGCNDQKQCAMQPAKESKFHPEISYVTRWNGEGVKHTVLLQEKGVHNVCPKMEPLTHVTLKGGLQAGDFTDVGKVDKLEHCFDICCQQDKCNLAFMLGQNCFSVVCKEKDLCNTTPAQPSIFNPQIAYVTARERTDSPVAKTVIAKPTMGISGDCPHTKIYDHMTLKGGVDAGAYKDHGKVKDMAVCRRICCEMTECHLAFMLGNNCFSVKCASVDACRAQKAKPSAYYPKISYIRKVGTNELLRSTFPSPLNNSISLNPAVPRLLAQPQPIMQQKTSVIPKTNLSLTQQPLVQTNNVVPLKVSTGQGIAVQQTNTATTTVSNFQQVDAMQTNQVVKNTKSAFNVTTKSTISTENKTTGSISIPSSTTVSSSSTSTTTNAPVKTTIEANMSNTSKVDPELSHALEPKDQDLLHALDAAEPTTQVKPVESQPDEKCNPGVLKRNVTLKGGRKSGEFIEIKGLQDMKECVKRCCADRDRKCNLAFMLGETCYSVACKNSDLCRTIPAPPTKFNPLVQYVRGLEEEPNPPTTPPTLTTKTSEPVTTPSPTESDAKPTVTMVKPSKAKLKVKPKSCVSQPIVKDRSIRGGKKAGKFKIFKDVTDMPTCIAKCCAQKKQCDVAYMESGKCYSIQCFKKSACMAIDLRDNEVSPRFAYMDHFLEKVDEEEAETEVSTDLDVSEDSACLNVEITKNKTLKGGTKAGKFHPLGKKNMKTCISGCCDRPDCDVAYLVNGHCYAVQCSDGKLCQSTGESAHGDTIQFAYMNKAGLGEKQKDYMVVYVIVGSLAFAATLGGLIWVVFAFTRKQRIKKSHRRLLDEDDDDEVDEVLHKRSSRAPRHRQPRY